MADRVVMVSADQAAREQLAAEMKELAKNPPTETVPGGKYRNAAGEYVDAGGNPIKAAKKAAEPEEAGDESATSSTSTARKGAKGRK